MSVSQMKQEKIKNSNQSTSKSKKQTNSPKQSIEVPEEIKKAGISSKGFDAEMVSMFKKMKAQGASDYAKEQVDKIFSSELSGPSFDEDKPKKKGEKVDYKSLFPGKQKVDKPYKEYDFPKEAQEKVQKEMKHYEEQEKFYQNKDLEKQKKKEFKNLVKEDSFATSEKISNKEFGWMDKVQVEDPKSKGFQNMLDGWEPVQRDYFRQREEKDDRKLNKELRKLEKIKEKRKIRDDYKDFKISLQPEVEEDIHQLRSKRYIIEKLEDILTDTKKCKVQTAISYGVMENMMISVHDIIISKSLSVIHVFFTVDYFEIEERPFEQVKKKNEEIRRKLVHSAPYIKGQLTQKAGLKYAPDIRFYVYDPRGSPRQVLDGLENVNPTNLDADNSGEEEEEEKDEDYTEPRLPGKYMKKKYYQEIGKPQPKPKHIKK